LTQCAAKITVRGLISVPVQDVKLVSAGFPAAAI